MTSREPRETLERRIQFQYQAIENLSRLVEESILAAVKALVEKDLEKAKLYYDRDQIINQNRFQIEHDALVTVATQQPIASDLRKLASIIDIAGELERIGDYAKGIARIVMRIGDQVPIHSLDSVQEMAALTANMLDRSIRAFIVGDDIAAMEIPTEDDQIDLLYNTLYRELLDLMIADRENINQATFLLWVSHNLERAADRVTNICERVIFTTSGNLVEFDRSDDESDDETEAF